MKKVKISVSGRVQGVGFRYMTKMVADKIGVQGIVRNEWDGSVYIEATGTEQQIHEFIQMVKASPSPSGRVDECIVTYDTTIKEYENFRVTN